MISGFNDGTFGRITRIKDVCYLASADGTLQDQHNSQSRQFLRPPQQLLFYYSFKVFSQLLKKDKGFQTYSNQPLLVPTESFIA